MVAVALMMACGLIQSPVRWGGANDSDDARVALHVAKFRVVPHVGADQAASFEPDPDRSHMGATVGVDGCDIRQRARFDQLSELFRQARRSLLVRFEVEVGLSARPHRSEV